MSRFRAYQITYEICIHMSNNCKSRWFHVHITAPQCLSVHVTCVQSPYISHYIAEPNAKFHGPGPGYNRNGRSTQPPRRSPADFHKKSILSYTIHRQGTGSAITAETICPAALDLLEDRLTINLIVYQNANICLCMRYVSMLLQHWIP